MMTYFSRQTMGVAVVLVLIGCSAKAPDGPPKLKTSPVVGIVHVDGVPASDVLVLFHIQEAVDALKDKNRIGAVTDDKGKFAVATYVANDGLPDGTYSLTFTKEPPRSIDNPFPADPSDNDEVQDIFNHAYEDPAKSEHKVTVKGKKVDMGVIELTTKKKE